MSFKFEDLSAEDGYVFNSILRDGDSSIARLGSSPEASEYLEQLENAYHRYGATNIRQAHFFLEVLNQLTTATGALDEAIEQIARQRRQVQRLVYQIRELKDCVDVALSPDPQIFGHDPESLISRIERLERLL